MTLEEKWKEIPNTNGHYLISNHGRVKSIDRLISIRSKKGRLFLRKLPGKILKTDKKKCFGAYETVGLGTRYGGFIIHRLVASLFCENDDPKIKNMVNHLDGNKLNNNFLNLEWTTNKLNMIHASKNGLLKDKLDCQKVSEIKKMLKDGIAQKMIAKSFGVTQACISLIKTQKQWYYVK